MRLESSWACCTLEPIEVPVGVCPLPEDSELRPEEPRRVSVRLESWALGTAGRRLGIAESFFEDIHPAGLLLPTGVLALLGPGARLPWIGEVVPNVGAAPPGKPPWTEELPRDTGSASLTVLASFGVRGAAVSRPCLLQTKAPGFPVAR